MTNFELVIALFSLNTFQPSSYVHEFTQCREDRNYRLTKIIPYRVPSPVVGLQAQFRLTNGYS